MHKHTGIFPGTFDPIHKGHLAFALETKRLCRLDDVVFLPEPEPRYKPDVSSLNLRQSWIKKLTDGNEGLSIASIESKQFTVKNSLPDILNYFSNSKLTYLLGSDVIKNLHRWKDLELLLKYVSLAIGMRQEDNTVVIHTIIRRLEQNLKISIRYTIINTAYPALTSTQIRQAKIR